MLYFENSIAFCDLFLLLFCAGLSYLLIIFLIFLSVVREIGRFPLVSEMLYCEKLSYLKSALNNKIETTCKLFFLHAQCRGVPIPGTLQFTSVSGIDMSNFTIS